MESTNTVADYWHGVSGAEFHNLALTYKTPFFLYDADAVNDRIRSIRESLAHLVKVFYAVKATPNIRETSACRTECY